MTKKELIQKLVSEATFLYPKAKGGQHCGLSYDVTLSCPEYGFELTVSNYRSITKNKELVITLFEIYLEEILYD